MVFACFNFTVNVDEFLQEAETLSVQDIPRSASSLSVRTDASGAAVIIKILCSLSNFYLTELKMFHIIIKNYSAF